MIKISVCLYAKKNYRLIKLNNNAFLVINTAKEFDKGHTHVSNFFIAKIIIHASIYGEFPKKIQHLQKNKRVLTSIIRVCSNKYKLKFIDMLNKLEE